MKIVYHVKAGIGKTNLLYKLRIEDGVTALDGDALFATFYRHLNPMSEEDKISAFEQIAVNLISDGYFEPFEVVLTANESMVNALQSRGFKKRTLTNIVREQGLSEIYEILEQMLADRKLEPIPADNFEDSGGKTPQ